MVQYIVIVLKLKAKESIRINAVMVVVKIGSFFLNTLLSAGP
jgi:hypothetical protein